MRTSIRTLSVMFLLALVAIGCGDDSSDDATTTTEATSTSVAGTEPADGLEGDETGAALDEGLTEADDPCVTELTAQGMASNAGVLDVQHATAERTDEGTMRLTFASYDYESTNGGGPGEEAPDVAEGEFLYVLDLQLEDASGDFQSGTVFMTEGSESTVEEGTADRATIAGTIVIHGLWQGSELPELGDTYVELLEVEDGQICGAIGVDVSELTDVATVTGRFVAETN